MNKCIFCGSETVNPKFCNNSCAASYNNKKYPKRKKYCLKCGLRIHGRKTLCNSCNPSFVDWSKITYEEVSSKRSYQRHSRIRSLARRWYTDAGLPMVCKICGYDKHIDVCHIKPINSFTNDTVITEINKLSNLVALCKNHHWELDHKLLSL